MTQSQNQVPVLSLSPVGSTSKRVTGQLEAHLVEVWMDNGIVLGHGLGGADLHVGVDLRALHTILVHGATSDSSPFHSPGREIAHAIARFYAPPRAPAS
jgi:hypothetical protein